MSNVIIRQLGLQDYKRVLLAMHNFTTMRNLDSNDEIWLVQHPHVFTYGQFSKPECFFLKPTTIPVVKSDRGGLITFHGPGQQLMYILIDLRRRHINIRNLINGLEQAVIATLLHFSIIGHTRIHAPGVYVDNNKICSLGLKIRKGCSLHGIALNVEMDLSPFSYINPCGCIGLQMTQISELAPSVGIDDVTPILLIEYLKNINTSAKGIQEWNSTNYGV